MHESGIIRDLVRRIEAAAKEAGAERIVGVTVRLGALSQFSAVHFREHFDEDARGSLAEGAALTIEISEDPFDPEAQSVMITSLDLQVNEEDG